MTAVRTFLFCLTAIFAMRFAVMASDVIKASSGTDLTSASSWLGSVPGASDVAVWTNSSLGNGLTMDGYESWDGIRVVSAATPITISGWGTLTLGTNGIDMSASTVDLSITNPIALGGEQDWIVDSNATLSISGPISGETNLNISGGGTVVLSGDNPMTGVTTVDQGTLVINGQIHYNEGWMHLNALTIGPGGIVIVSSGNADTFLGECNYDAEYNTIDGGVLEFDTASGTSEPIERAFTITSNGGTIQVNNTSATLTFDYFSGEFQFSLPPSANLTLSGAGNGLMNKNISGFGGVIVAGTGTWTLGGTNTYIGTTTVSNGTLMVTGSVTGDIVVMNGAGLGGSGTIGGNLVFSTASFAAFDSSATLSVSGALSLNGNTVHLKIPENLAPGTYALATYNFTGSSGTFANTPVIDSGSLTPGNIAQISTAGGGVTLTVEPPAPHLVISSVNGGVNPDAGVGFDVAVEVLDAEGNPLILSTDTNVTLMINAGSGALNGVFSGIIPAGTSSAKISGVVYTKAESGVVFGVINMGGTLQAGNSAGFTVDAGLPAMISLYSGNNGTGIPGTAVQNPFVVSVTDSEGNPVQNVNVNFFITGAPSNATDQSLSLLKAVTDANGHAATTLTFGNLAGTYSVAANSAGLSGNPVIFTAQAVNGGMRLIWSDEFDYDGLPDLTKWSFENGYVRNGESQWYTTNRIENACVTNGTLIITARQEEYWPPGQQFPVSYTSASLTTQNKESWQYGKIELRAKLPYGNGTWPTFWSLGTNFPAVGWPACGELDIMEYVGRLPGVDHINAYYGTGDYASGDLGEAQGTAVFSDPSDEFHVFAIDWDPNTINFYVDCTNAFSFNVADAGEGTNNPFRQPIYLIMDFALGGAFNGYYVDDSILPQQFIVDYVRVYKKFPIWTGGGGDNNWSTSANWATGIPYTGDLVTFTGTTNLTPVLDISNNMAGLTFDAAAGSFTLTSTNSATLILTGAGLNNSSSNLQIIDVPTVLAANQAITTDPGDLNMSGVISGNGYSLTKAGTGTLRLFGSNTYTGSTIINGGTLALGEGSCILSSTNIILEAGGILDVSAFDDYTNSAALCASGTGQYPASIIGAINGTIDLSSNVIDLRYDGTDPALTIAQASLVLGGNTFNIHTANGIQLGAGVYPLIQVDSGTIMIVKPFQSLSGTALAPGVRASLSVVSNNLSLVVLGPTPVSFKAPIFLNNGIVQFSFTGGDPGISYRLQAIDNLLSSNWTTLTTLVAGSNGLPQFIDFDATNHAQRFYRLVTP